MELVYKFQKGELPLCHLKFGTIILLPKKKEILPKSSNTVQFLLNVSFKIFTEVGTNYISAIAPKVMYPTQTTFLPGRHML